MSANQTSKSSDAQKLDIGKFGDPEDAPDGMVAVDWDAIYTPAGRDIEIVARIKIHPPADAILQLWLRNEQQALGLPEDLRWVQSGTEFEPDQGVLKALIGLVDSKWDSADYDQTYTATVSGYVRAQGKVFRFRHEKTIVYPRP